MNEESIGGEERRGRRRGEGERGESRVWRGEERKEEDKPRARKLRRLGAANGTPAPKKTMAEDGLYVRTPVSRKRGKVKS